MSRINTNIDSLIALHNLTRTSTRLGLSLTRLSTGVRVNSGKDDPAGLIAGEFLRQEISSIESAIGNNNRANNMIATADASLREIANLLDEVRGLLTTTANRGVLSQEEREANQSAIDAAIESINRISNTTQFAGRKLIDGSLGFQLSGVAVPELSKTFGTVRVSKANFNAANDPIAVDLLVIRQAERATISLDPVPSTGGDTVLQISGNRGTTAVTLAQGSNPTAAAAAINAVSDVTGVTATAAGTNERVSFTTPAAGTFTLTFGGQTTAAIAFNADAATIQAALEGLSTIGTGNVSVSGVAGATSGMVFEFRGALASTDVGAVTASAGVIAVTTAGAGPALTLASENFGSDQFVTVRHVSGPTGVMPGTPEVAEITDSGVDVAGTINGISFEGRGLTAQLRSATLDIDVTFRTPGVGVNTTFLITSDGATEADEVQTVTFSAAAVSATTTGTFSLLFGSAQTAAIAIGATSVITASNIRAALEALPAVGAGNVTVVDTSSTVFTVTFAGNLGDANVPELTSRSSLTTVAAGVAVTMAHATTTQGRGIMDDFSITGGGARFQLGQNIDSVSQVNIGIDSVHSASLGNRETGFLTSLVTGGTNSVLEGREQQASQIVNVALRQVAGVRSRLGSFQRNAIETNINSLEAALENITAARSQIVDTDFAEETATLTRLQILVQAGTSALAIANARPQTVLTLLG